MTKPSKIIRILKIHIHGIPYVATFTMLKNNVVDSSYSMLLGMPWFKDAKVTHEWGNNVIIVQGNGTFITILVNRKLGIETKKPQVLICYDLLERLTNEEEDMIFEIKLELFSINTIIILDETVSLLSVGMLEIRSIEKFNQGQRTLDHRVVEVMPSIIKSEDFYVRPKIPLENKVYRETYYHHN